MLFLELFYFKTLNTFRYRVRDLTCTFHTHKLSIHMLDFFGKNIKLSKN